MTMFLPYLTIRKYYDIIDIKILVRTTRFYKISSETFIIQWIIA